MTQPKYREGNVIRSEQTGRCYRIAAIRREGLYELIDILSHARYIEAIAYADKHWVRVEDEEVAA